MNHFDEMTGLLCLEGQLDAAHAQEVRAHAATCAACRELLHALESEGVWLRKALEEDEESVPARLMEAPARGGAPWGWIAGLGFAAGGAYTVWSGFIEPVRVQAEQAGFSQGNLLTMLFFSGAFWKGWDAMRSLMEFLAIATLGTIVIWLLRRHLRRVTTFAVMMGAIAFALTMPRSAMAGETRHGDPNYTLAAGEEIKTDLFVAAERVQIEGDLDGDLIVSCKTAVVNGHVKGDILFFGQDLRVNGTVDGNVRSWAGALTIIGNVGKNVMSWSGDTDLEDKGRVGGSMTIGSGDVELNGQVGGDVLAATGSIEINGSLGHDAMIRAGELKFGPHARVEGRTKYEGRREAVVSADAKLASPLEFTPIRRGPDYTQPRYYWHRVLFWGASFLFGLVMLLLAPGFYFDAQDACKKVLPAAGFGLLFLIATPIAALIVCFTIVGIGLGISTFLMYAVAVYSTQIFVGGWLGEKLLGPSAGIAAAAGRLALGLAIIRVLRMIPYFWVLVLVIVLIWGMGGIVLALYKRVRTQTAAAA